jgi:hypothetical protein
MRIVVYSEEDKSVFEVVEDVFNLSIKDDELEWIDGSFHQLKHPFIVLEDDSIEIKSGDILSDEIIAKDTAENYYAVDEFAALRKENEDLKARLRKAELDNVTALEGIAELYEMIEAAKTS